MMVKMMVVVCLLCLCTHITKVHALSVSFESFSDNTPLTTEVPGLELSGGTVLTAGISLNEIDYPPTSGSNVLAAFDGTLVVNFINPTDSFSGYFTFSEKLNILGVNSGGTSVFSFNSPNQSNLGQASFFEFTGQQLSSVAISTLDSSAFTLDDLSFSQATSVPEPSTLAYGLMAGGMAWLVRRRKKQGV